MIKVVTIVVMIVAGACMIVFGLGIHGVATGVSNLWKHGGFFPNGGLGMLMALQMVMFAYLGWRWSELPPAKLPTPESRFPMRSTPSSGASSSSMRAASFVILAIYPWNEIGTNGSPFVMTFERLGIKSAAGIINFVVLTAALSSRNGGIYSTGRMLYNLAKQGQARRLFQNTSPGGVPRRAIQVSSIALLFGVLLNYLVPAKVFVWVTSIATFAAIWTWTVILLSQMKFRKSLSRTERDRLAFRMPFYPYSSWLALAFLALVIVLMGYFPGTRVALLVGPLWLVLRQRFSMGSDSIPLATGVPFPPILHFLTVPLMGRLRPHEPESRMFGDSPFGPIGRINPTRPSSASINEKPCDPQPNDWSDRATDSG